MQVSKLFAVTVHDNVYAIENNTVQATTNMALCPAAALTEASTSM